MKTLVVGSAFFATLGYERIANWAFQARNEEDFVNEVLAGQPEPPGPVINVTDPPLAECLDDFWSPGLSPARLRAMPTAPVTAPEAVTEAAVTVPDALIAAAVIAVVDVMLGALTLLAEIAPDTVTGESMVRLVASVASLTVLAPILMATPVLS
jgi:hypothetical protein